MQTYPPHPLDTHIARTAKAACMAWVILAAAVGSIGVALDLFDKNVMFVNVPVPFIAVLGVHVLALLACTAGIRRQSFGLLFIASLVAWMDLFWTTSVMITDTVNVWVLGPFFLALVVFSTTMRLARLLRLRKVSRASAAASAASDQADTEASTTPAVPQTPAPALPHNPPPGYAPVPQFQPMPQAQAQQQQFLAQPAVIYQPQAMPAPAPAAPAPASSVYPVLQFNDAVKVEY